jgi:hypothetical protein
MFLFDWVFISAVVCLPTPLFPFLFGANHHLLAAKMRSLCSPQPGDGSNLTNKNHMPPRMEMDNSLNFNEQFDSFIAEFIY